MRLFVVLGLLISSHAVADEAALKYSVFGFVSAANKVSFDRFRYSGNGESGTGSMEMSFDSGMGLGAEVSDRAPFGWAAGVSYDLKRKLNSADVTTLGVTDSAVYAEPKPTLSFWTMYVNAVKRWDGPYAIAGFNCSIPSFDQGPASGSTSVSGGIGGQVGAGYEFTKNIAAEFLYRSVALKTSRNASGYQYDLGSTSLAGFQIQLKYSF